MVAELIDYIETVHEDLLKLLEKVLLQKLSLMSLQRLAAM
jgi:hypothetical protein